MRILIIGSSGMMGTALEKVCNRKGFDCVGLNHENLEITDRDGLNTAIDKHQPTVVINLVAMVGTNPCELEPQRAFNVNSIAVSNLAKICEQRGIILVQPGSQAVFDGTNVEPYVEDDSPNPTNIYSASKYLAECFAINLCTRHYVPRFPTLFGPTRFGRKGFVENMFDRLEKGGEIRVADDRIDSPTYTMDAAATIISLLENKNPFGIYHVTNSGMVSYYDFIANLAEIMGIEADLVRAKEHDFDSLGYKPLRLALLSVKLGPNRSWQDALSEYVTEELKLT